MFCGFKFVGKKTEKKLNALVDFEKGLAAEEQRLKELEQKLVKREKLIAEKEKLLSSRNDTDAIIDHTKMNIITVERCMHESVNEEHTVVAYLDIDENTGKPKIREWSLWISREAHQRLAKDFYAKLGDKSVSTFEDSSES